jgi:DNA topoisomerase IB
VLAAALRFLDLGVFRTGGEEYAEENGAHGLATLLREHVTVRGDVLLPREGWHPAQHPRDEELVKAATSMRRAAEASDRLLAYRNGGAWHEVRFEDINERFKELAGEGFTAKDLRTWNATVLAAVAFADTELPSSERGRKRAEAAVTREVAEGLGNTPAVARRSYVDPRVDPRVQRRPDHQDRR